MESISILKAFLIDQEKNKERGQLMEIFGIMPFVLLLSYSDYPSKTKRLGRELKKLKRRIKGENEMSKLLSELKGENCEIKMEEDGMSFGGSTFICTVLDVDDEWLKIRLKNRKDQLDEKLVRIENVESIELAN